MNFTQFRRALARFPVFSISDIRGIGCGFDRRRLTEWQDKGYITKIIKGFYVFADQEMSETMLHEIANRIYAPSYVSLETAMSHHHLIPESVYAVTSVSTRRTYRFETPFSRFTYRTISRRLFFGYDILQGPARNVKMASMEKALLDFFYLHPELKREDDFASLRINRDVLLERLNKERFSSCVERFGRQTLAATTDRFMEWTKHA